MKAKQNKPVSTGAIVKFGSLGGLITVLLFTLLSVVGALLVGSERIPVGYEEGAALVVRVLAFLIGAALTAAFAKEGKLQTTIIAVGIGLITVIALAIFVWDGMSGKAWLGVIECVLAGAAGLFLNMLPGKRKRTSKVKYR